MVKVVKISSAIESMEEGVSILSSMIATEKKLLAGLESYSHSGKTVNELFASSKYFSGFAVEANEVVAVAKTDEKKTSVWAHIKKMAQGILEWITKQWDTLLGKMSGGWKELKANAVALKEKIKGKFNRKTDKAVSESIAKLKQADDKVESALGDASEASKGEAADEAKLLSDAEILKAAYKDKDEVASFLAEALKEELAEGEAPISESTANALIALADENIKKEANKKSLMDKLKAALATVVRLAGSGKDEAIKAARAAIDYCSSGIKALKTNAVGGFNRLVTKIKGKSDSKPVALLA